MALTTLPYPNMDFTPLDILTADELDHIVANYTAINNATIATANLANGAVTNAKIDWSTTAQSYSTSEVDTGATWINGKHIYKKTINFGALPNNSQKVVSAGVADISKVIKYEGYAYSGSAELILPYLAGGTSMEGNVGMGYLSTTGQIRITTGLDRSNYTECYITIWYIKN